MALLTTLFATALLMGLGLSIVLVGTMEFVLGAHDRNARALREASLAAAHLAIADLRAQPSWSAVLAEGSMPPFAAVPGRAIDPSASPVAPWGGAALDLLALTADVRVAANTGNGDPQVWRIFESARLDRLLPGAAAGPWYLVVWVADDWADGDGDPAADTNGILAIRAVAFGPGGSAMTTVVSLMKTTVAGTPDRVRVLTIRSAD
jgi:hypothetical protein